MFLVKLALKSLRNRKFTAILTIATIALCVTLLLAVERIRNDAKLSFTNTVSGTDLIIGARSGPLQLLLYSVFRIGNPTNNISWKSYNEIIANDLVQWSIPISLGDTHRGYRVMGTNERYFQHFRYARNKNLTFSSGNPFSQVYEAVIGSQVAEKLNYKIGSNIIIAHGGGEVSFIKHDDKPFTVVGILKHTGTPVDHTVHISLEGIEAIHIDWQGGARLPGLKIDAEKTKNMDLTPKVITAFFLGLKSRISTFKLQRKINEFEKEPLLAIIPGVTLQQLWDLMSTAEQALVMISAFVIIIGMIGMLAMILSSLNERRREMAVLRATGAQPMHVVGLLISEATFLAILGVTCGVVLFYLLLITTRSVIENEFGLLISIKMLSLYELGILCAVIISATILGLVPAYRAYKNSLSDGISIRL